MDDKLEKFIKTHRAALDQKEPKADLWDRISAEMAPEVKNIPAIRMLPYWRAAAAIFLVVSVVLAFDKFAGETAESTASTALTEQVMNEAESYYIGLINQKKDEISAYSDQFPSDNRFIEDINTLDSVYQELKTEMSNGNEESVLNAMIQNLQLRIEVLNHQLEIIQSIEKAKKEKNENINI